MNRRSLLTLLFAVAALCAAAPASAQQAALSVGARVSSPCRISIDSSGSADGVSPGVRLACGRSALRSLRVATDRDGVLQPLATLAGRQMRAGGEIAFVVAQPLATVASLRPSAAVLSPADRQTVTVTLDF